MKKKYSKLDILNQVAEFHRSFEDPISNVPRLLTKERATLRVSLLQEELNELKKAIEDGDLVEMADAYADLQYVLSGAILETGLGEVFSALVKEVHRSNMTKACKTMDEVVFSKREYEKEGVLTFIRASDEGLYVLYRQTDGKVLKSKNYSEANLEKIINRKNNFLWKLLRKIGFCS